MGGIFQIFLGSAGEEHRQTRQQCHYGDKWATSYRVAVNESENKRGRSRR